MRIQRPTFVQVAAGVGLSLLFIGTLRQGWPLLLAALAMVVSVSTLVLVNEAFQFARSRPFDLSRYMIAFVVDLIALFAMAVETAFAADSTLYWFDPLAGERVMLIIFQVVEVLFGIRKMFPSNGNPAGWLEFTTMVAMSRLALFMFILSLAFFAIGAIQRERQPRQP